MLEVIHNASFRSDVDEKYMFRQFDPAPDEDETLANTYLIELDEVPNSIDDGIEDDEVSSQHDILEMEEVSSVFDDIDEDDQVSSESITETPIVTYMARFEAKAKAAIAKLQPIENEGRSGKAASYSNSSWDMRDDSLYLDYGIHSEQLEQPLIVRNEKALHYRVLVNTPHGRHLLMISLLEQLGGDMWNSKCEGRLKIFLPETLRSPYQPDPPQDACLLDQIIINGRVVLREEVMYKFDLLVPQDMYNEMFSWYKEEHSTVINSLVDWVLEQESFGSSLSLLVTIKERLNKQMFVELVNMVVAGMEDTGFVMPSIESYMPEDFFTQDTAFTETDATEDDNHGARVRRQAPVLNWWQQNQQMWRQPQPPRPQQTWQQPTQRPVVPWQPTQRPAARPPVNQGQGGMSGGVWSRPSLAEAEWYFREDPVANAHHTEWHRAAGRPFQRWGEYFYYMHSQMLARYEAERLSLRMGLTTPLAPGQWISDSYDPRLGARFAWRPSGNFNSRQTNGLLGSIHTHAWNAATSSYVRGIDWGISGLGQIMETGLHNVGHSVISEMSGGRGVMGSPIAAMRDPVFFRWHGFVESVFKDYKNRMGRYSEVDLGFPGIDVVNATVQPQRGAPNTFYTYREMASVNLNSLDSTSPGSRMSLQYSRMNHRPFTWNIVVNNNLRVSRPAIVRIFMMPRGGASNRATIHMDHFYTNLNPGVNQISRDELEAPHLSKSRWSLSQLQSNLMNGQVGRGQFSWGGCGWPRHLNIPRGMEGRGMEWTMVVMVSQVLAADVSRIASWNANRNIAWSYCGVSTGVVPDSRPLGFPTDRDFGNINNLVGNRDNWAVVPVSIVHGTS